jgi:probable HAF family extracellular repeat protein
MYYSNNIRCFKRSLGSWVLMVFLLALSSVAHASIYNYTIIDEPGAYNTRILAINDNGQMVGDGNYGFMYDGSTFTTILDPNGFITHPLGINNSGQIVGWFEQCCHADRGFLYDGSTYTTIHPGDTFGSSASWISDSGLIYGTAYNGYYAQTNYGLPSYSYIFIYSNGVYQKTNDISNNKQIPADFNFPNAKVTYVKDSNNSGQVVGFFESNDDGRVHGFLATPVAVPLSGTGWFFISAIVGWVGFYRYSSSQMKNHGFPA